MKKSIQFLANCCLFVIALTVSNSAGAQSLTPAQWREDLQFLQKAVHTRYSNLFYNVTAKQFDSAVNALEKKIGGLNDVQMRVEFMKLVAMFKVGHTAVRQRAGRGNDLKPWVHNFPATFYLFPEGLYVKSIDEEYKQLAGAKVIKIGNVETMEVLEKLRSIISFENEQGFKSMIPFYLNVPEFLQALGIIEDASVMKLTYEKNGNLATVDLKARNNAMMAAHGNPNDNNKFVDAWQGTATPLWLKKPERLRYFEYLPESKTVYVRHSAVQNEADLTIEQFFSNVFHFADSAGAEKFILDIRMNGGGNNYLNKPVITGLIQSKKINRKGHLFVITGKATFSAAQNLTNELEIYTEAIFAGEPTSENVNFYGDTRTEVLPNSLLNVNLSWLWWQNLDPRDKRKWTAPQLAADMSFADYQNGRDPVMEMILNYKETEPIESKLTDLVKAGKTIEAINVAKNYFNDPVHRYYKTELESKINSAGYALINKEAFEYANKLFAINTELFPNSANVYDSYAESFLKLNKKEEAIKNYKIAIEKDPQGATGENARNILKDIEARKGF